MMRKSSVKKLLDYKFQFAQAIYPVIDSKGKIKEFYPQDFYDNKDNILLNKHGDGAFCKFTVDNKYKNTSGVYAFYTDDELIYIGQCKDFVLRFNCGYGNISPRNCYVGGQSTNCKINKIVLEESKNNSQISIYFYSTDYYDYVEKQLIEYYQPKYNDKLKKSKNKLNLTTNNRKKCNINSVQSLNTTNHIQNRKMSTHEIELYLVDLILHLKNEGNKDVTLKSGEVHKKLNLKSSMTMVCNAMRNVGKVYKYEIIEEPPKRNGSRVIYKYFIK